VSGAGGPPTRLEPASIVTSTGAVAAPLPLVWALVSDFGRVDRWSAGPVTCTIEGSGVGAVRTVRTADRTVRERLESFDPVVHRLTYSFVDGVALPVEHLVASIEISGGDSASAIRWSMSGAVADADRAALAETLRRFFDRRIGELQAIAAALASGRA
jgi:Polyketide cyclase / dehydrase and lipid transport